jgi:PAS domain S-box-containing protein
MENDICRAVNALPGLVWTALPDGQIDFLNHRWCEYTGLSLDEGCGHGWRTAIHPEDLPKVVDRWRSILSSGERGEMEARLRRFDGEYRCFLMSTNPMRDEAGQVVKWYGLSLFGLVLAIGLVVDDAIVVVEGVERYIEEGMTPKDAG